MSSDPQTRVSLLLRLKGDADEDTWREFLAVYRPLIYRLARGQGLQAADAEDVTQQALLAVSRAIGQWQPGGRPGSFRAWLFTIARNLATNLVARTRMRPVGGTSFAEMLRQQPDRDESLVLVEREYQAELFRWAAAQVREEVEASTWEAFWRTTVDRRPVAEVAAALFVSVGSVYAARSRVMARLKRKVRQFESDTQLLEP
jgi:RNA polymerase sigma-70 factor (ECF subfamily)